MHAVLLAVVLSAPGQCPTCQPIPAGPVAANGKVCRNYTPPVRWFCKPCAGCAGGVCQSCNAPLYGSLPYNYRVQFDYPWSQRPAYPPSHIFNIPTEPDRGAEIIDLPEEAKAQTRLKTSRR